MLEDPDRLLSKLSLVIKETSANNIEVYTMEAPCCHAIHMMINKAIENSRKNNIKTIHYIVRVESGEVEVYKPGVIDESMVEAERKAHGYMH